MKRPLIYVTLGYILGIIWGLYCKISIVFLYLLIISIYFSSQTIYKQKNKFKLISFKRYFRYVKLVFNKNAIVLIIIASSISYLITINQNKKYERIYTNFQDEVSIVGTVVSREREKSYKYIYKLKVETVNRNNEFCNAYLFLDVNKKINKRLEYGDKVEVKVIFKEPEVQRNYGGFDYKEYLKTIKVYGTAEAKSIELLKENNINCISAMANKLVISTKQKIERVFSKDAANILIGIIFGDTTNIDEDIKESFKISNISHILAVSGMHVSYIIIGLTYIFEFFGKRASKILISIFLVVYMFITNFTPSVVRASVMSIVMLYSGIFYRKNDIWTSMSISILILLIYNPFLIKNISVQFSYGGTIGIILFQKNVLSIINKLKIQSRKKKYKKRNKYIIKLIEKIKEILSVTISAQIIIMPIMIFNFNTIGIYFLIANLIVSIVIGSIVILGFTLIILSFVSTHLIKIISTILEPLLQLLTITSRIISDLEFSTIYLKTPRIISVIIYYIFIFISNFLYKTFNTKTRKLTNTQIRVKNLVSLGKYKIKENRKRVISVILVVCIIFLVIKIYPQNLKIYFIDVGQGDSTLIVTSYGKTILIDGGGSISSDFDVGESTLFPYLLDRRVTKLDYIIVSHFDQDHVGGLVTVMEKLKVDTVVISKQGKASENYKRFKEIVNKKKIKVLVAGQGDTLKIEKDLYFDILWPNNSKLISENVLNNNSIVCKLYYKNFSMLFTGDIEEIAEKQILEEYKNNLQVLNSTILKVGHHGSKTSSIQEFIEMVKPKIALIGVGKNNNFGHPNDGVLESLEELRCKNI